MGTGLGKYTGVLREANQTCVNVYDVIEMCAPAAPPIMLRIRTRSLNPNPKPLTLTLTLFLTVTGTKFLKENKTGQKLHQNIGQHRVIFPG